MITQTVSTPLTMECLLSYVVTNLAVNTPQEAVIRCTEKVARMLEQEAIKRQPCIPVDVLQELVAKYATKGNEQ